MLSYCLNIATKKSRDLMAGKPHRLSLDPHFQSDIFIRVENHHFTLPCPNFLIRHF